METWSDVWVYLCNNSKARAYDLMQYYCENPNEIAKAFWNGVLTILEAEGKLSKENGINIWNEITKGGK